MKNYESSDFIFDHRCISENVQFSNHMHDVYEILFLNRGAAFYTVEGKTYLLEKHSFVITPPLKLHSVSSLPDSDYDRYNILFDANKLSSPICNDLPDGIDVFDFRGNTIVCDIFGKMKYYSEQLSGPRLQTVLTLLVEELLYNVSIAARQPIHPREHTANEIVNAATKYVEENLSKQLSVESVCKTLHVSQSYLQQLFGKHLMITPKQYILSKKLAMAQVMLRSGGKPVEVFSQCGFTDYSAFFRAYKNHFGHAPSEEFGMTFIRSIHS